LLEFAAVELAFFDRPLAWGPTATPLWDSSARHPRAWGREGKGSREATFA